MSNRAVEQVPTTGPKAGGQKYVGMSRADVRGLPQDVTFCDRIAAEILTLCR